MQAEWESSCRSTAQQRPSRSAAPTVPTAHPLRGRTRAASTTAGAAGAAAAAAAAASAAAASVHAYYDAGARNFRPRSTELIRRIARQQQLRAMQGCSTLHHLPRIQPMHELRIQPYLRHDAFTGIGTHLKMRCRTGTLQVNALLSARRLAPSAGCPLCGEEESVTHVLLQCPAYDDLRETMLDELRALYAQPNVNDNAAFLQCLGVDDCIRAANILSDFYWRKTFAPANSAVCDFLAGMWANRQRYLSDE